MLRVSGSGLWLSIVSIEFGASSSYQKPYTYHSCFKNYQCRSARRRLRRPLPEMDLEIVMTSWI